MINRARTMMNRARTMIVCPRDDQPRPHRR